VHVVVCDSDAPSRFAVSRLLKQTFGCRVTECTDGVQALQQLGNGGVSFLVLEMELADLSGLEVLEMIRAAAATRNLPVIVMSRERREDVVARALRLGVSDYVLKPVRSETLSTKIARLVRTLPAQAVTAGASRAPGLLTPDTSALVVDGDLNFRSVFSTEAERYGPLRQADSGARAVAMFKELPSLLVFVGGDLGVVDRGVLVQTLRKLAPSDPPRIVGLVGADDVASLPDGLFDDVVVRTFLPKSIREQLQAFVRVPGPLSDLLGIVPTLKTVMDSAVKQVFGMMFDAEVVACSMDHDREMASQAVLEVMINGRLHVTVRIQLTTEVASGVATRMFSCSQEDLTAEDLSAVAGEIGNLVVGRLHAHLRDLGLSSVCSLPALSGRGVAVVPEEGHGLPFAFSVTGAGDLFVGISVATVDVSEGETAA
jgi:CheY-like chemotaxis protein/CheY-specific phosphatase CheX